VALPSGRAREEGFQLSAFGSRDSIEQWTVHFERLRLERRVFVAEDSGRQYWVAAERGNLFGVMHPGARVASGADFTVGFGGAASPFSTMGFEDAVLTAVQGWMAHIGPTTADELGDLIGVPASEVEKALLRMEASGAILRGTFRAADSPTGSRTGVSALHETRTGMSAPHEWCERRLLARIHRLTVATLRKQIEPVTAAQFMNWLLRWQHIAPGTQVRGEHGTLEVIRQLQGFEIPASAWERFVLGRRITAYDPAHLDQLCLAGAVGWGRLSPHPATLEAGGDNAEGTRENRRRVIPTRVAPIAFFVREDADWMRPHHPGAEDSATSFLSHNAQALLELLKQRGALFFPDMVRATGKLKAEVETGLWELVAAGLVTADGFENLRSLVTPKNVSGSGLGKARRPRHAAGRWSLLHAEGADRDRSVESCCWMLLRRYGVVFRDLLVRETNLPRWRELQIAFRRLEDRGEVRGGRFVDGFLGEQFALPVAVESLRAHRKLPLSGERVTIAAADPLNLVGIVVPGERIPAISGRSVTFRDGVWVAEGETLLAAGL
jgi:ATP-dependent helicase Lhr and Lhr-like helicase